MFDFYQSRTFTQDIDASAQGDRIVKMDPTLIHHSLLTEKKKLKLESYTYIYLNWAFYNFKRFRYPTLLIIEKLENRFD